MTTETGGEIPNKVVTGDAVVLRVERDGFGMIRDTKTNRLGYFTLQTTTVNPRTLPKAQAEAWLKGRGFLRIGAAVQFVAEDRGTELLNVTELRAAP